MASFRYLAGLEGIGDQSIDMLGDDIRVALVSSAYDAGNVRQITMGRCIGHISQQGHRRATYLDSVQIERRGEQGTLVYKHQMPTRQIAAVSRSALDSLTARVCQRHHFQMSAFEAS